MNSGTGNNNPVSFFRLVKNDAMDMLKEMIDKRFPFFEPELRQAMEEQATLIELNEGDELIREGQYIKSFPILLEGNIRVSRHDSEGRELLLYFLGPGETCSMALTCCMGQQQSNIQATAEQPSTLIRIPVGCLDQWMSRFPSWKTYMMWAYRKRFDELLETIDAIAFMELDQRLVRFLMARFRATGEKQFRGTHQEIALSLNSSREVISRLLKQMEQKGLVSLGRGTINFSTLVDRQSQAPKFFGPV
jgi:CRP/FNR family transcriptional regulator